MMRSLLLATLLIGLALWAGAAGAQQHTILQAENVRFDYAQVLRVTPVYQTLTATRIEQRCDPVEQKPAGAVSRAVGALKDVLRRQQEQKQAPATNCRTVAVEREFRRPIAYDVDYVYRGAKFRSRLADDPGDRLRIRFAVTPAVPGVLTTAP
ncbi:hypothetical protein [Lysobacter fragariae]